MDGVEYNHVPLFGFAKMEWNGVWWNSFHLIPPIKPNFYSSQFRVSNEIEYNNNTMTTLPLFFLSHQLLLLRFFFFCSLCLLSSCLSHFLLLLPLSFLIWLRLIKYPFNPKPLSSCFQLYFTFQYFFLILLKLSQWNLSYQMGIQLL